jgi:hypothetical protein
LEQVAHGEDGAPEVRQHHDSLAAVRTCDRLSHGIAAGAEGPPWPAARGLDSNLRPGDLGRQIREAASELEAVGDKYNPDQIRNSPFRPAAIPDDGRSLHYRQEFSNAE